MATTHSDIASPGRRLVLGFLGGLLGGTLVGICESIVVLSGNVDLPELGLFPYSVVTYGILCAFLGLGLGFVGLIISRILSRKKPTGSVMSFYLTTVFVIMAIIIGRFRIVRDMFHEKSPGHILDLIILISAVILFFILHRVVFGPLLSRKPLKALTKATCCIPVYIVIFILTYVIASGYGNLSVPPAGTQSEATRANLGDRPNVILIIVDTLRADRLSCYGYDIETSPHVDALAADGIRFSTAISQASWTKASIATVFSSLYPSSHRAIGKPDQLPDDVVTLAEAMKDAGYYTTGFADNINIAPVFNFDQGFYEYHYLAPDHFFYAPESATQLNVYNQLRLIRERFLVKKTWVKFYYQDAVEVTNHVIDWLDGNREKKFFLMAHYMDVHDPYFVHPYNGEGYARVSMPSPPPEMAGKLSDLYDDEITFFDREFGRLIDWLKKNNLYDGTVILVTADHGEEFYEHNGWWHGTTLYDEQIHIPLIVKPAADIDSSVVITSLARSIDIMPTLLDLADVAIPPTIQGRPLLDSTLTSIFIPEYVFSEEDFEGNILKSVRDPYHKLILANRNNPRRLSERELYDLQADPREMNNLAGGEPELEALLKSRVESTASFALEQAVGEQTGEIDESTHERLKALGYVE